MKLVRVLLFPLMPLYFFGAWARNKLFDFGILKSKSYNLPIICIGNLSTGGTGKTPMVEYLIRLIKDKSNVAVLSRGYKRKTKGFVMADFSSTVEDIGDEPYQYYSKFANIKVAVDESRVHGIDSLLELKDPPHSIILDDAFQHRYVDAGLNILLTSFDKPFYEDVILPTGNLREPRMGYKRAHIIIVTKSPDNLEEVDKIKIVNKIKPLGHQRVFFSSIKYGGVALNLKKKSIALDSFGSFTLVTGIANPQPFVDYLKSIGHTFKEIRYPDHHDFSERNLADLQKKGRILTTEKDFVRLSGTSLVETNEVYYIPIEFTIDRPKEFEELIEKFRTR
ncbi:MAG: tetraacyldisaccharide 4'-kinase [Bacteroidota bacterium]